MLYGKWVREGQTKSREISDNIVAVTLAKNMKTQVFRHNGEMWMESRGTESTNPFEWKKGERIHDGSQVTFTEICRRKSRHRMKDKLYSGLTEFNLKLDSKKSKAVH